MLSCTPCGKGTPNLRLRSSNDAVERVAVNRDRVLHIGDSYESDILGARAAGLDAALLLRATETSSNSYRPTLRSLDEVFSLLD